MIKYIYILSIKYYKAHNAMFPTKVLHQYNFEINKLFWINQNLSPFQPCTVNPQLN